MGPPVTESVETGLLAALFRRRSVRAVSLVLAVLAVFLLLFAGHLWQRFGADRATEYADIEEHFKYGSTGGEHESGFPYWIFQALPQVCAKHLPGDGYASLGLIFEDGKDLPVGMSKRRHQGIDKTFLNCAVCHASTVRDAPGAKPRLYLGMPAKQLDIMAFEKFFFNCAKDPKFAAEFIVPEARRLAQASGQDFDLLDRYVVYPVAVALMRERLLMLAGRFGFVLDQPALGPGPRRHVQLGQGDLQFPDGRAVAGREERAGGLPVDLAAGAAPGHAAALGRQQHDGRGAQQERGVRHRDDTAHARPAPTSDGSRSGCAPASRRSIRIRSTPRGRRAAAKSTRSTAPPATARADATSPAATSAR